MLRGESLRGSTYQAIYTRGRVTWDAAAMNEYSRDHPEVLPFRKEGQPSVTLRLAWRGPLPPRATREQTPFVRESTYPCRLEPDRGRAFDPPDTGN